MTTTLGLVAFGILLGTIGAHWLDRSEWPLRSPALGIVAWQALTCSVFLSLFLAGVTLAVHEFPEGPGIIGLLHACSTLLVDHDGGQASLVMPSIGLVAAALLGASLVVAVLRTGRAQRRETARQLDLLHLVCLPHSEPDVVVLQHSTPTVYCLPGRRKRVVVTEGALNALTDTQLDQVLAHERAHLRSHHHIALGWADAFVTVFRGRLGSAVARSRIAELAEMHADDAADQTKRWDLATAVLVLAGGARPVGAMGAGGSAVARIHRLVSPATPVRRHTRAAVLGLVTALLLVPALIATAPGLASTLLDYCPFLL